MFGLLKENLINFNIMKKIILTLILFINTFYLFAQPGWNWPENKAEAEEKNVLYTDYLKQQNCEAAVEHLDWLIDNVPSLHVSIYQLSLIHI